MTWAGGEAGTQVSRLFSCEGTAAQDPAFGAGPRVWSGWQRLYPHSGFSHFHFSFFLFASLAFRFGSFLAPLFPLPGLGRAGAAPSSQRRRVERGGVGEGLVEGRFDPAPVGGPMEPATEIPGRRGGEWRPSRGGRWVGSEGFLPRRSGGPRSVPQTGELCLAFPKGLRRQLCRGEPSPSPPSPATYTPFRAVAHWFLGC